MAYLKLVVNPDDDVAALRVVNTPRRGVGTTSIYKIRELAADEGISFFSACQMAIAETGLLGAKVRSALAEFTGVIEASRHFTGELADVVEAIVDRAGLIRALEAEHSVEADGRIENIKEFMGVAAEFDETHDAVETLEHYGYRQYEISNFAVPGYESRHNMRYWRLGDYLGFGAGAHSCMDGARFSYVRDADRYIVGVLRDEDIVDEYSRISSVERGSEYIMLGMRTALGIEAREYTEHYRADFAPIEKTLRVFAEKGWAKCSEDGRWSFTPQGFLLSNLLIGALLEAQSGSRFVVNHWM